MYCDKKTIKNKLLENLLFPWEVLFALVSLVSSLLGVFFHVLPNSVEYILNPLWQDFWLGYLALGSLLVLIGKFYFTRDNFYAGKTAVQVGAFQLAAGWIISGTALLQHSPFKTSSLAVLAYFAAAIAWIFVALSSRLKDKLIKKAVKDCCCVH